MFRAGKAAKWKSAVQCQAGEMQEALFVGRNKNIKIHTRRVCENATHMY